MPLVAAACIAPGLFACQFFRDALDLADSVEERIVVTEGRYNPAQVFPVPLFSRNAVRLISSHLALPVPRPALGTLSYK